MPACIHSKRMSLRQAMIQQRVTAHARRETSAINQSTVIFAKETTVVKDTQNTEFKEKDHFDNPGLKEREAFSSKKSALGIDIGDQKELQTSTTACVSVKETAEPVKSVDSSLLLDEQIHSVYIEFLNRPCEENVLKATRQNIISKKFSLDVLKKNIERSVEFKHKRLEHDAFLQKVSKEPRKVQCRANFIVVKYLGIYGTSGIGKAVLGYVAALASSKNILVVYEPSMIQFPPTVDNNITDPAFECLYESSRLLLDSATNTEVVPDFAILHGDPAHWKYQCDRLRKHNKSIQIGGLVVWETDLFPNQWLDHAKSVDFILVPCKWNLSIVQQACPYSRVFVWPHVVDVPTFPVLQNLTGLVNGDGSLENTKTLFLFDGVLSQSKRVATQDYISACESDAKVHVLTIGQWNGRKNIHGTITVFLDTFCEAVGGNVSAQDVVLYVKTFICYSQIDFDIIPWLEMEYKRRFEAGIVKLPAIYVDLNVRSDSYMSQILHRCAVFFILPKSEGVGFGACDAHALGKRVVMPSYGGQCDYVDTDYWVTWKLAAANFCDEPICNHLHCGSSCRFNVCVDRTTHRWCEPDIACARKMLADACSDAKEKKLYSPRFHVRSKEFVAQEFRSIVKTLAMLGADGVKE